MRYPILFTVPVLLAGLSACTFREGFRYDIPPANQSPSVSASSTGSTDKGGARDEAVIVLFAPIALGPIASLHPQANVEWANDLAIRVSTLSAVKGRLLVGRYNETIPSSDAPDWAKGRVPGLEGVSYVVLTEVVQTGVRPGMEVTSTQVTALVEMRVLDRQGNVIFRKRGEADTSSVQPAKLIGPNNQPKVKASFEACVAVLGALHDALQARSDDAGADLIPVAVTSTPSGAEVLVDGVYRGVTPMTLRLTPKAVTISINKDGYLPWVRNIQASKDMKIQPELVRADSQK